jgi:hypothetical protein
MSSVIAFLDRLHARARASPLLYRVVLATRCLFAMAFIPTGWVKLMGDRFTQVSVESPVGAFFEAMYQTGGYWQFLGATQVVAGLLMLVPRAATLGAVIFFPVALNIFVITVALDFRGTPFFTGPMLFAAAALLAWDWDRLRGILTASAPNFTPEEPADGLRSPPIARLGPAWERAAYVAGTAAGLLIFGSVRGLVGAGAARAGLAAGLLAALVALAGAVRAVRSGRRARVSQDGIAYDPSSGT